MMTTEDVTTGLNRGGNNRTNTISAAKVAFRAMKNIYAVEFGNEPVFPCRTLLVIEMLIESTG